MTAAPGAARNLERGARDYRRANTASLRAGYAIFSPRDQVQPSLPALSTHLGVSPAQSSLTASLSMAAPAGALLLLGPMLAVRLRRRERRGLA